MGTKKDKRKLLEALKDLRDRLREESIEADNAADTLESLLSSYQALGLGASTHNAASIGKNSGDIHQSGGTTVDPYELPRAIVLELRRGSISRKDAGGALAGALNSLASLGTSSSTHNEVTIGDNSGNVTQSGTINVRGDWRA